MKKNNKKRLNWVCLCIICTIILTTLIVADSINTSKKEEILEEYTILYKKIESVDNRISKLEESYNLNVKNIYKRILEIQNENPDEVREAVIDKLSPENGDSIKFEASVLAILEIYDEFQSDIQIQTYLNDNASILESIDRYETMQDKYNTFLSEYNHKYLEEYNEE